MGSFFGIIYRRRRHVLHKDTLEARHSTVYAFTVTAIIVFLFVVVAAYVPGIGGLGDAVRFGRSLGVTAFAVSLVSKLAIVAVFAIGFSSMLHLFELMESELVDGLVRVSASCREVEEVSSRLAERR